MVLVQCDGEGRVRREDQLCVSFAPVLGRKKMKEISSGRVGEVFLKGRRKEEKGERQTLIQAMLTGAEAVAVCTMLFVGD